MYLFYFTPHQAYHARLLLQATYILNVVFNLSTCWTTNWEIAALQLYM